MEQVKCAAEKGTGDVYVFRFLLGYGAHFHPTCASEGLFIRVRPYTVKMKDGYSCLFTSPDSDILSLREVPR